MGRHSNPGGGGAGLQAGWTSSGGWGSGMYESGTIDSGGAGVWNGGRGGGPGQQGNMSYTPVGSGRREMSIAAGGGDAIIYAGNIKPGSVGLGADRVRGKVVQGVPGAPRVSHHSLEGKGDWGAVQIVNLVVEGAGVNVTAAFISGGGNMYIIKYSNTRFGFYAAGAYSSSQPSTWTYGTVRFTATTPDGKTDILDFYLRCGYPVRPPAPTTI